MTRKKTRRKSPLERRSDRRLDRMVRELNAPATPDVPLPLPIALDWEPGVDLRRYAQRLAASNGHTLAQIMGTTIESQAAWRVVGADLRNRLSALTGQPPELFAQARQYTPVVKRNPITGWVEPGGTDPTLWIERLPDTQEGRRIRDDVRTTSWPAVRLHLLTRLTRALIPHLSASWPPHSSFDLEERAAVVADETRSGPIEEWSPRVRRYALTVLWDHTSVGVTSQTEYQCRTPVARDVLIVKDWRDAAAAAHDADLRRVGESLEAAVAQWPPAERPTTPAGVSDLPATMRIRAAIGPLPGPFSVHALRIWPPVLLYTVHVADIALDAWRHHQEDLAVAWTFGALREASDRLIAPVEPGPFDHLRYRESEPPRFASAACRLLATENGRRVVLRVADLAGDDDVVEFDTICSWWPRLRNPPDGNRNRWASLRGLAPELLADLLWVDLTGHLPSTLVYEPSAEEPLYRAARAAAPEDVLAMRDWAMQIIAGGDLPLPGSRRLRPAREATG